ncbi:GNAT family N-acetyltransferase, partial [Agromyces seonyuensis]
MRADLRPIPLPDRLSDEAAAPFLDYVALAERLSVAVWGDDSQAGSAAEWLAWLRDDEYRRHDLVGAYEGERLVGYAASWYDPDPAARSTDAQAGVAPEHRRSGVGSALLAHVEAFADDAGRSVVVGYSEHSAADADRPGPALRPPDGAASLPADEPAAAFALAHGY